jgi:hypothetical protein
MRCRPALHELRLIRFGHDASINGLQARSCSGKWAPWGESDRMQDNGIARKAASARFIAAHELLRGRSAG